MGDIDPRFKALKFYCWLGVVPFKEVQGQSLILVISNQKGGRKLEILVWRITRYLRKLEQFRIQPSLQVFNESSKTMNRTSMQYPQDSIILFHWNLIFFTINPIIVRLTCLQNKSSLIKLGLNIYRGAVRLVIDHTVSFKNLLC